MKSYTAITKDKSRLITVLADDFADAKNKVTEQLNRPGRKAVWAQWILHGRRMIETNTNPQRNQDLQSRR